FGLEADRDQPGGVAGQRSRIAGDVDQALHLERPGHLCQARGAGPRGVGEEDIEAAPLPGEAFADPRRISLHEADVPYPPPPPPPAAAHPRPSPAPAASTATPACTWLARAKVKVPMPACSSSASWCGSGRSSARARSTSIGVAAPCAWANTSGRRNSGTPG